MKLTVSTTNQPAPKLACPVTLNGKMFVVTKCSDSDTGPPLQSLASDSLAHKIAHSFMVPKQQRQQPANQPTLGEDAGFSQKGGGNTAWHLGTTLASGDSFPPLMK